MRHGRVVGCRIDGRGRLGVCLTSGLGRGFLFTRSLVHLVGDWLIVAGLACFFTVFAWRASATSDFTARQRGRGIKGN